MKDSNYTLRFARTAREAYGHDIEFAEDSNFGDKLVGWASLFAFGFLLGLLAGRYFWS